jgi:hypothetical protein
MNWMCDVYVYEDCMGGWTTHVAGNRKVIPPIPELSIQWLGIRVKYDDNHKPIYKSFIQKLLYKIQLKIWGRSHQLNLWSGRLIPSKNINLAHDGETFNDPTPQDCANRLIELKTIGYIVPQYAIDALQQEQPND